MNDRSARHLGMFFCIAASALVAACGFSKTVTFEHLETNALVDGGPIGAVPPTLRVDGGALGAFMIARGDGYVISLVGFSVNLRGRVSVTRAELSKPFLDAVGLLEPAEWEAFSSSEESRPSGALHVVQIGEETGRAIAAADGDVVIQLELMIDAEPRSVAITFRRTVRYWPPTV